MNGALTDVDHALTALAVAIVAVAAFRGMRGSRSVLDLTGAPTRHNLIREDAVLLIVCVYMLAAALMSGLMSLVVESAEDVRALLVVNNGAHIAAILACLVITQQRFAGGARRFVFGPSVGPPSRDFGSEHPSRHTGAEPHRHAGHHVILTVGITVLALGLCPIVRDATMAGIHLIDPEFDFAAHRTIAALHADPGSPLIVVALWVGAAVVAPAAEEFFFRGIGQTYLLGVLGSRWAAILVTSFAFGMIHFQQIHAVPALVVLGILVGYAYERTGSLVPPIAIHAAFNLKTLVWNTLAGAEVA